MFKKIHLVLLLIIFIDVTACSVENNKAPEQPDPLLLISFDGFRHDFFALTDTPNFDVFSEEGVRAEGLIPVFPSKTFPNHYSIATGLYPENSGLIGNTMYDAEFEEWYRIRDREAVEAGKWYRGEPIWNTVEKQGLKAGTLFWVGSEAPVQDRHPTYWKPYDGSMSRTARIDTVVQWLSYPAEKRVDFATLYFDLVDKAAHDHGLQSDALIAAVSKADSLLGYLKSRLLQQNLWSDINIIILSDHGMTPLAADKIIELEAVVDTALIQPVTTGPVGMIRPKPGQTDRVYQQLKKNEQNYRVYRKENLPERYHLKESRRLPAIIMVADLGYMIMRQRNKDSFIERLPLGMHGYDNNEPSMQGIFLARGPSFKKDFKISSFQNIHIYELMTSLLNSKPAPNDGSLDSVRVMLKGQ